MLIKNQDGGMVNGMMGKVLDFQSIERYNDLEGESNTTYNVCHDSETRYPIVELQSISANGETSKITRLIHPVKFELEGVEDSSRVVIAHRFQVYWPCDWQGVVAHIPVRFLLS